MIEIIIAIIGIKIITKVINIGMANGPIDVFIAYLFIAFDNRMQYQNRYNQ